MGLLSSIGSVIGSITGTPWLGALGGGIDSLMTSSAQSDINSQNQQNFVDQQAFNADQAQKNRDFQTESRANQYQVAVKDMEAAGLNPMLAYSQGGAGNLSGATASSASAPNLGNAQAAGMQSAQQAAQISATMAQTDNIAAQTELTKAQTDTERGRPANVGADTERIRAQAELAIRQGDLTDTQNKQAQAEIQRIFATTKNLDADTALKRINEVLQKFDLPRMKAEAAYFGTHEGKESPRNKYGAQTPFRLLENIGGQISNSAGRLDNLMRPKGFAPWTPQKGAW